MTITLTRHCAPGDNSNPVCSADFTINGRLGHQKLVHDEPICLEALWQQPSATYCWNVISTPADAPYVLTPILPYGARLALPHPGAYVVQLSLTHGDCHAQSRYILWVLTPRLLYSLPATNEPLRLNGKAEWAGDLARLMLDVDQNLPTEAEKWAMTQANSPGRNNPFATLNDLPAPYSASPETLTPEQLAAIRLAHDPSGRNPFLTEQDLHERPKIGVTRAEKDAMEMADNPCGENPFVTRRELPIGVSRAQKQALNAAENPCGANPYVTQSMLPTGGLITKDDLPRGLAPATWPIEVTPGQKAALDAAEAKTEPHKPNGNNAFVTETMLPTGVTDNQKDALDAAEAKADPHKPSGTNAFVTETMLPTGVTDNQKDALDAAEAKADPHKPSGTNAFVTETMLPTGVTDNQKDALDAAEAKADPHKPSGTNAFVTETMLPTGVTDNQKAALNAAEAKTDPHKPNANNAFVTETMLPTGVTDNQKAALDAAEDQAPLLRPSAINFFVTKNMLPQNGLITKDDLPKGPIPPIWPEGLTPLQKAALDAAEGKEDSYKPSGNNAFVTETMLPTGVTDNQKAALNAAEAKEEPHKPSGNNAFVTETMLPTGVTDDQKAALNAAEAKEDPHKPNATNAFVTETMLPTGVTDNQKAALNAAEANEDPHKPSGNNAFVTETMLPDVSNLVHKEELPDGEIPATWPIGVSERQKAALDAAEMQPDPHKPDAGNPFVTQSMLTTTAQPSATRIIAAGCLDLAQVGATLGKTAGGLTVVYTDPPTGRATLAFDSYTVAGAFHYVVKALPINPTAGQNGSGTLIAQFVEFNAQGFVLNLCHLPDGKNVLAPCMIEVTQLGAVQQPSLTLEEAIRQYYALIRDGKYEEAWPMLSDHFRYSLTPALKTLAEYKQQWTSSGYAELMGMELVQAADSSTTYILDLNYPKAFPEKRHKIRYLFERRLAEGHPSFNYWLFISGQQLSPPKVGLHASKAI